MKAAAQADQPGVAGEDVQPRGAGHIDGLTRQAEVEPVVAGDEGESTSTSSHGQRVFACENRRVGVGLREGSDANKPRRVGEQLVL